MLGAPTALPKRPGWITALTCLGRPKGMRWRWAASFPMWRERNSLGGIAFFPWGKGNSYLGRAVRTVSGRESSCLGGTASFPGKASSCRRGEGGRESTCLGRNASFPGSDSSYRRGASFSGRESTCLGRNASFPGSNSSYRRGASFSGREGPCLGRNASFTSRGDLPGKWFEI